MVNSSNKGFSNERKVAKLISTWWSGGSNQNIFWRTGGSGGRATRSEQFLGASYGDLGLIDPLGEPLIRICTIELKKGYSKDLDLMSLIDTKTGNLFDKFWVKACLDAEKAQAAGWGSEPILITHRDRKMPLITLNYSFHLKLIDYSGKIKNNIPMIAIRNKDSVTRTMRLHDFLDWLSPSVIQTLWNLKRESKQ